MLFLTQIETTDSQYGVLKIQNSPPPTGNVLSFANPAYEPSAAIPTYKVEDVLIRGKPSITTSSVGFVALKSKCSFHSSIFTSIFLKKFLLS